MPQCSSMPKPTTPACSRSSRRIRPGCNAPSAHYADPAFRAHGGTRQGHAAASQVLAHSHVTAMKLDAYKYYYIPTKDNGLAGIVAKSTADLLKLQADLIAAVTPFTVETGNSAAFVTTPDDPIIDPADQIRFGVCAEGFRRTFQSACHHRSCPSGIPGPNAGRTV